MADIYLRTSPNRPITGLPPVCLKCGAPATVLKSKQFRWQPLWVLIFLIGGPIPYLIASPLLTRRKTVETPLCDRHGIYWWFFPLMTGVACFSVVGFGLVVFLILEAAPKGPGTDKYFVMSCFTSEAIFIGVLVVTAVLSMMRIRATMITDEYIRLWGVSQAFVDMLEEEEECQRWAFDRGFDYRRSSRPTRPDDE